MSETFPIVDVTAWPVLGDEMMGTKPKCWLLDKALGLKWLFKQKSRKRSDDNATEKAAAELASLFGIPHATVELAVRRGEPGIISRDIVHEVGGVELIHGNSLLFEADTAYPADDIYSVAHHTIERIFAVLDGLDAAGIFDQQVFSAATDIFTGYLLFDAWIGNTDRHHQNWGVVADAVGRRSLAPSFDHAASLGHLLSDEQRRGRLTSEDKGFQIAAYARKGQSAIFRNEQGTKPVTTDEAFAIAAGQCPVAARHWLEQLARIDAAAATDLLLRLPESVFSPIAVQFAVEMLRANQRRLEALSLN